MKTFWFKIWKLHYWASLQNKCILERMIIISLKDICLPSCIFKQNTVGKRNKYLLPLQTSCIGLRFEWHKSVPNTLNPKISLVILLTICQMIFIMLARGIWYLINWLSQNWYFLYSHHLSAWYCIDIVRRNSVLVTHGS